MRTVRLHITGRVQGVGYRAWATLVARDLGLRGWVRNRIDGTVELLASGPHDSIAALIEASHRGPPAARVTDIQIVDDQDEGTFGFVARPTK
jgi:acylphosphatase